MIPHAVSSGLILPNHLGALEDVRSALSQAPQREETLDCHDLCRLTENVLRGCEPQQNVRHYRGTFFGVPHSWLLFEADEVVLDVYPVDGASGPILVSLKGQSPWKHLYIGRPVADFAQQLGEEPMTRKCGNCNGEGSIYGGPRVGPQVCPVCKGDKVVTAVPAKEG